MLPELTASLKKRMDASLGSLHNDLKSLRTGRASANLLDGVRVEAYGDFMPLNQVATVSAPEPRLITVQVWDKAMIKPVEKAIVTADLGLSPVVEGQLMRIAIPLLSEERRKDMVKVAHKYAEQGKIAVRNIRRDGMEEVKKLEKDNAINKDQAHQYSEEVQKITDNYIKTIEQDVESKEKEIMQM